jgi:hypothetical protein
MKKIALCLALLSLVALGGSAFAEIGTIDDVPAATLLLPYFEVDLGNASGITTLFSINNASASAAVAHVTMWTDKSIPTLDFDVYLTGYDVQTINVRDIFNGNLPRTADAGADTPGTISPKGSLSQDINFPGSTGPCGSLSTVYPAVGALSASLIDHIRKSHTGQFSSLYGGCSAANYGDNIARGYITVDSVTACNLSFPSDAGYFTTLADNRNILWGDYFYVNPGQNFAAGETLVHVEACSIPSVGNGAGQCPFSFAAGDYTFYGRYNAVAGQDQREPLASTFAARYVNGGGFDGGTDFIVWRDSKTRPTGANGTYNCTTGDVSWFPLNQSDVVAFDEIETPTDLCFRGDNISPPTGGSDTCYPLETQRVHVQGGNVIADDAVPPSPFGWMYLNLNHTLASGDPYPGLAQAWVTVAMFAEGRYEVGYDAIQLDNLATPPAPGGVILIP